MSEQDMTFHQRLLIVRIIWAALCMGVVMIAAVLLGGIVPIEPTPSDIDRVLMLVSWIVPVTVIPVTLFVRRMIFRNQTVDGRVKPEAYMTGSTVGWAGAEGGAIIGIVMAFVTGQIIPNAVPAAISFLVLVALFPTGRPMLGEANPYRPQDQPET